MQKINDGVYDLTNLPNGNIISSSIKNDLKIWNPITGLLVNKISVSSVRCILVLKDNYLVSGFSNR